MEDELLTSTIPFACDSSSIVSNMTVASTNSSGSYSDSNNTNINGRNSISLEEDDDGCFEEDEQQQQNRGGGNGYIFFKAKDFVPGINDVLIGRGKKCYTHKGNEKLRLLVESNLKGYSTTSTKSEKSNILCSIINSIRDDGANSGAFVKQDTSSKLYYDVGDIMAKEKISQTFRDCLQDTYKSSVTYKKKRRQEQNAEILAFRRARAAAVAAAGGANLRGFGGASRYHHRRSSGGGGGVIKIDRSNSNINKSKYKSKMNLNNDLLSLAALSNFTGTNSNNNSVGQFNTMNDIPSFLFQHQQHHQNQYHHKQNQYQHKQNHYQQHNNESIISNPSFDKITRNYEGNGSPQITDFMMEQKFNHNYNIKNSNKSGKNNKTIQQADELEEIDLQTIGQKGNGGYYNWFVSDFNDDDGNDGFGDDLWNSNSNDSIIKKNNKNGTATSKTIDEQLEEIDVTDLEESESPEESESSWFEEATMEYNETHYSGGCISTDDDSNNGNFKSIGNTNKAQMIKQEEKESSSASTWKENVFSSTAANNGKERKKNQMRIAIPLE